MSIPAHCDSCGKKFMVPDHLAGRTLPCKACGEPLTIEGDGSDEAFDSRPQRAPAQRGLSSRRRSVSAPGSQRRRKPRSSIPRWLPFAIVGVVGAAAIVVAVILLLPASSTSHEGLARDAIAEMDEAGALLEGVQDEASARAAIADLQASGERLFEIYRAGEEFRKTDPLTEEAEEAMRKSLGRDRLRALDRINAQTRRINENPQLAAILREPISQFVSRAREGEKERIRRDVDDWVRRQEEMQAKAREAFERDQAAQQQQQAQAGNAAVPPGGASPGQVPTYVPGTAPGFQLPDGYLPPGARPGFSGRPVAPPPGPDVISVEMQRPQNFTDVRSRLKEIAGAPQHFHTSTVNGQSTIVIAPVTDLQGFAARIDFGRVAEVDPAGRRIVVTPDEAYRFQPGSGAQPPTAARAEEQITVGSTFVHEQFGAGRVAALALRGLTDDTPEELIKTRVAATRSAIGEAGSMATSWEGSGSQAMYVVGPVADFDAFAAALDIGELTAKDPAQRLLVINVDAAKLRPEPKRVADLQLTTNHWPGKGRHGGKVIPVNGGEFLVEAWMDQQSGNLVIWLSDRTGQPVAVRGNSLTLNIKRPGADLSLRIYPAPHPDDPADVSSRFLSNLPEAEAARKQGIPVELHVPLGGKTHIVRL